MTTDTGLTMQEQATNFATMLHIARVRELLGEFAIEFIHRGNEHDRSKLERPEVTFFAEVTAQLAGVTYGSPEYEAYRQQIKPGLDHHYARNRHHPEFHKPIDNAETHQLELDIRALENNSNLPLDITQRLLTRLKRDLAATQTSVNGMNLADIVEMLCDWKASSERHNNGNIRRSIEKNAERFGLAPQLVRILENSVAQWDV